MLYLGANVPLKDLEFVAALKKPDFLYTHLTSAVNFNFEKFLNFLHLRLPAFPVVVSGQCAQAYKKKVPASVTLKKSLFEVWEYVSSI